eukprot:TRINITY_DN10653_c0_g1_i1.p1 TRINITY_DN10653_c0_g1~~TRINITY_DN10653_c0_g1_i1.p1  ORF type:complete len:479 (-),score=136.83 TRINITY_DN10653_c0_g1_i1:39-1475(-)
MSLSVEKTAEYVNKVWDESIIPVLSEYISIPNVSPVFDSEWDKNGLIDKAADLLLNWAKKRQIKGLEIEKISLPGLTPVIFATIPATKEDNSGTILMYGHLDKQPPMTETWFDGLQPYVPEIRNGKLYGRGGADDGYSICASLLSIEALQLQGVPHARVAVLIEASEESGSIHLPQYVDHLAPRIGTPNLIVCLDSGCANYEQFWTTTSLRGMIAGDLKINVLTQAVHSGQGSGIIPSSFRVLRMVLDRIEDTQTGEVKLKELYTEIPQQRIDQTNKYVDTVGKTVYTEFAWDGKTKPVHDDLVQLTLNRTWRPALSVTGAEGLPELKKAGNVVLTHTHVKLSMRIPPRVSSQVAADAMKKALEENPPYGATVTFTVEKCGDGWDAPALAKWLDDSMNKASENYFKKPANFTGEGGSIPFMGMLGRKFPEAQFVITGLLGPLSNAHGPNEFLHIDMGKKVTACVASIVSDHHTHFTSK